MIVRVCRRVAEAGVESLVATDDERIRECVENAGFKAIMTSPDHRSGTDRVREAYEKSGIDADVVINVQGDEPFIAPSQIRQLSEAFTLYPTTEIATLVRKFDPKLGFEALFDPSLVKVVVDCEGRALYFSRSIVPYVRAVDWKEWLSAHDYLTHVGIYAYRVEALRRITELPHSALEKAESLEQLRWLENGIPILTLLTDSRTIGIDTPADLAAAELYLQATESMPDADKV